ncbi:MAG: NUDIX hydrolase, partial [Caldisericia bacterium]|nr:NUDIX hydrolase [Caldisericia bacterium]
HYVIIDVVAEYLSGEIRVGSDALDLKWIKLEEVKDYPLPERVKDAIEKGRRVLKDGEGRSNR